uniref:Cytochrome c oxidase assembly factor 3 mitochondrial coiled-coil domain-containing protein n=1 Tax=Globodera rostochiensis TaxID=31243 RepID=A0A914GX94_GLORO
MSLKLSLFYDILCPRSWVFYQALQKKLPYWKTFREFTIDYVPVSSFFLHEKIHHIHPAAIISRKKDYMLHELYDICDFYGLQKGNFEVTYELYTRRTRLCLSFLNYLRLNRPEYYQKFLEKIWSDFWHKSASFNHTSHFFMIGHKRTALDMNARHMQLLFEERIVDIPWLRIDSVPGHEKLFGFTEILRLEMLDKLMAQPCYNPLNHNVENPLYHPLDPEEKITLRVSGTVDFSISMQRFNQTSRFPIGNIFFLPINFNQRFGCAYIKRAYTDGPLTVRGRSPPAKKRANAADEIARTKFELLEPAAFNELPRGQQRFVRQIDKSNRTRVRKLFALNYKMIRGGLLGLAMVIAIYLYTIWVLRQETFLEEIDEEVAMEAQNST